MALSLGVRKGSKVRIGDEANPANCLEVVSTYGTSIVVKVQGRLHLVTEEERMELFPGVKVSSGSLPSGGHPRLAFEAARHITITREE